ncbi:MAG: helix-turn-helix transcriptional regulator [Clostridiales bacterium]|nr:helix-turn-helix transcriptional regulator [Candidatus Equinaster intestinalis]
MFKIKARDGTNNLCGKRIAEIRKQKKLSQRGLAAKMQLLGFDVDHYFIRRAENGERFLTDIDLMIFSKALETPIIEFFPEDLQ